jgi:hypothetical protein
MKTNKTFAYGFLTVILALAFIACPDDKTPESNPPVANAQAAPTHTLADNLTITLDGTDSTGNISAYAWECESYTADQGTVSAEYTKAQVNALITNADTATATVKPRKAGTYKFKLTVTGNDSESDTDTVTVVVESAGTVKKDVTATIPGLSNIPAQTVNFAVSYNPVIAEDGFEDGDVVYTITDGTTSWDSTTGYTISAVPYDKPSDVVFILNFKYKNGTSIESKQITASVVASLGGRFAGVSENPSIGLSLEKTVTEIQ